MVAMATTLFTVYCKLFHMMPYITLFTVYCKLFHMMPYIIILKVRKFHQPTASRFSTARKKPVGGHIVPPSLNRVNQGHTLRILKNTYPCDPTRKMQIAQTNRVWVKTTINQGHILGPLKNTYPCDPTRKMQIAQTNRVWVKTTINRGHTLRPCSTL